MKALQNAARNREGAGGARTDSASAGDDPGGSGELSLEPQEPSQRPVNRGPARPADDFAPRQAAPGPQQAQTVLRAGARPSRPPRHEPGILDAIARRPLVAFSTAAGLFAIGYGTYLYLELTNPGMFASRPTPPPPPPRVAAAPQPPAPPAPVPQPATAPAGPDVSAPSGAALPGPAPADAGSPTAAAPAAPRPASPQAGAGGPASQAPAQTESVSPPAMTASAPAPARPAATQAPAPATRAAPEPAVASTRAAERPPAAPSTRRGVAAAAAAGSIAPAPSAGSDASASSGAIAALPERAGARARPAAKAAATREPPEGVAPASGAQIVAVDNNVLAAYQALEQGRLDDAERLYRQAMTTDPRNVDAMLGLAATLTQQNKADAASQLYMRVLEQEPRNTYAQAGLLNIAGRADPAAAEARLKQLIAREPSAFLYFALGNLYSARGQWAAAQGAYFQAHNLAPDNPDYAFNLAVGLEHLSQPKIALDYYRRAVALAKSRGHAQFESARVENRIRDLEATLAQQP